MVTYNQSLIDLLNSKYDVKLTSTSYLGVSPGDIVALTYPRKDRGKLLGNITRLGFIMTSSQATDGIRLSSRLNTLLNFVDAESISDEQFLQVVDKLYTEDLKPIISQFAYQVNKSVGDFKTLNVFEISGSGVFKITLTKKEELQ